MECMVLESSKSEPDLVEFISDPSDPIDIRYILDKENPVLKELTVFKLESLNQNSSLKLLRSLELEAEFENGLYILDNDLFNLFSFGKTVDEALCSLETQFEILWENYVLEDDEKLTVGAIELKNQLKEYFIEK